MILNTLPHPTDVNNFNLHQNIQDHKKKHTDKPITVQKLKPLKHHIHQNHDDKSQQIDSDDSTEDEQIQIKLSEIKKKMNKVKRNFDNGDHHPILSSELIVPQYESQTAQNAKATRKNFYEEIARKLIK